MSTKCGACSKKVGVLGFECKCGSSFCSKHRLPEDHQCSVNIGDLERKKLENRLVRDAVVASKLKDRLV